jgi:hypothetical protein
MQDKITYISDATVKLRPHVNLPEEPCGIRDQQDAGCYQEAGESHKEPDNVGVKYIGKYLAQIRIFGAGRGKLMMKVYSAEVNI